MNITIKAQFNGFLCRPRSIGILEKIAKFQEERPRWSKFVIKLKIADMQYISLLELDDTPYDFL